MLQVNKDQNGDAVEVAPGESFEIQLPENPTTGYRWHIRSPGEPVLEVQDDSFQASAIVPGAGGVRCWRFRAAQEGTADLEMDYKRSWEKGRADSFRIHVRVKPR
jgi:inhibitor of cysteine peptidase